MRFAANLINLLAMLIDNIIMLLLLNLGGITAVC